MKHVCELGAGLACMRSAEQNSLAQQKLHMMWFGEIQIACYCVAQQGTAQIRGHLVLNMYRLASFLIMPGLCTASPEGGGA